MQTLSNIVKIIEDFATAHKQVNEFSFGKQVDMAKVQDYQMPLLHVLYTGSTTEEREKTYDFEIFILSRSSDDAEPQEQYENISDMEEILHDLLSEVQLPQNYFKPQSNDGTLDYISQAQLKEYESLHTDKNFQVETTTSTPLVEDRTGMFCGIQARLSVKVSAPKDSCYTPYS